MTGSEEEIFLPDDAEEENEEGVAAEQKAGEGAASGSDDSVETPREVCAIVIVMY